ncbi:MAG: Lpp/OprI family alanine-zipper lipoprotein [Spongiibacteraceae bacterium]|jgi:hypothetical protein|nr:Lpp/OprI family alanine-zipper lipoprotein [Spongiibacteraceae bacterium]
MKTLLKALPIAAFVALAGCANNTELSDARATAEAAQRSADEAKAAAAAAERAAADAQATANQALQTANEANTKIDSAFKKSMYK